MLDEGLERNNASVWLSSHFPSDVVSSLTAFFIKHLPDSVDSSIPLDLPGLPSADTRDLGHSAQGCALVYGLALGPSSRSGFPVSLSCLSLLILSVLLPLPSPVSHNGAEKVVMWSVLSEC